MRALAWALVPAGLGVLVFVFLPHRPTSRQTPTATAVRAGGPARVFLILRGDGGRHGAAVGCGDSLIGYSLPESAGGEPLKASLRALLALPASPAAPADSYNALGRSSLHVAGIGVGNGVAHIALAGKLRLEGRCNAARAAAQLTATVTQFPQVRSARITINGRPLEKLLSLRG